MVTSKECLARWGQPVETAAWESKLLVSWPVPAHIRKACPCLPPKIYTNKLMVGPMEQGFNNLIERGHANELKTWNGSYAVRLQRGSDEQSLHSWAVAFDVNKDDNGLGKKPKMSKGFAQCFIDGGFDWGGNFKMPRTDGMHFQLKNI